MKPTLSGMDCEKPPQVVFETESSKRSNKRLLIGIISGITLVLVIVAAILLALFMGAKVTKDAQKEAWLNYKDKDGEPKSEHVTADAREEDYTVPNEMRVIYDFEQGYAVHKLERSDDDPETVDYNVCYVSHLDRQHVSSPDKVKDAITDNEMEVPSDEESEELHYKTTRQVFDRDQLSPRAKEMCKDSKVFWMVKSTGDVRQKRDCYVIRRCSYYLVTVGDNTYLVRKCDYYLYCN